MKECVYLGSRVAKDGGNKEDFNNKLTRPNQAFAILQNMWKPKKAEHENENQDN